MPFAPLKKERESIAIQSLHKRRAKVKYHRVLYIMEKTVDSHGEKCCFLVSYRTNAIEQTRKLWAVTERMVMKSRPGCFALGCWAIVLLKALK